MCCKIDLNSSKDAAHFLGKTEPTLLPKTADNLSNMAYKNTPAKSLFDKWLRQIFSKHAAQGRS